MLLCYVPLHLSHIWQSGQDAALGAAHVQALSSARAYSRPRHFSACILQTVSRSADPRWFHAHTSKEDLETFIYIQKWTILLLQGSIRLLPPSDA